MRHQVGGEYFPTMAIQDGEMAKWLFRATRDHYPAPHLGDGGCLSLANGNSLNAVYAVHTPYLRLIQRARNDPAAAGVLTNGSCELA